MQVIEDQELKIVLRDWDCKTVEELSDALASELLENLVDNK